MKHKIFPAALLILSLTLSGCYDQKEIDETSYIVALGIDKGKDENFTYTFQFSEPLAIMGKDGEEGGESSDKKNAPSEENSSVSSLTISASDFYIAKNMTNNFLSKNVDMSHLKLIVFSADMEVSDLENHSRLLLRERRIRPHTAVAVAAKSAGKYLENVNPELESNTSKYYELMSLRSNNVYAPTKRLKDFVDEITSENRDTALPIALSGRDLVSFPTDSTTRGWISPKNSAIDSDRSVLCGMGIFKNGRLTCAMDGDSAMIFNILTHSIETCTITISDKHNPGKALSFRLTIPEKASYDIDRIGGHISIRQSFEPEFLGGILPEGYSSRRELYAYAESVLQNRVLDFFMDLSHKKSADILNLRSCLRKDFLTWDAWQSFDWDSFYKAADFSVNFDFL